MNSRAITDSQDFLRLLEAVAQDVHMLESQTGADRHTGEGVVGDVAGHSSDLHHQVWEMPEHGAAAGKNHPFVNYVGRQFRRRLFQHRAHRPDDRLKRLSDGVGHLIGVDLDRARQAGDLVAAADLHADILFHRHGAANGDLDLFGRPLADAQVVLALDVVGNGFVEAVAPDSQGASDDDPVERDHRDLGGAAADVDNHIARGIGDRHASPDGRSQRFGDQKSLARPGGEGGVPHGPPFDAGHPGRNADHDLWPHQREAAAALVDEVAQHLLGDDVVGDHPVSHRAHDFDRLARLATKHIARFQPDRFHLAVFGGDRYDGRLVYDDATTTEKDEDV